MKRIQSSLLCFFLLFSVAPAWGVDTEILIAQGIDSIGAKNYPAAVERLEQALAEDPDNAEACYYAGLAYSRLGDYPRAEELLRRALALEPNSPDIAFELGILYARTSDCGQARTYFDSFRRLAPGDDRTQEILQLTASCEGTEESFLDRIQYRLQGALGGNYDTNVTLEADNPVGPADRRADFSGILFLSAGVVPLQTDWVSLALDYDFFQSFHVEESSFNVNFNKVCPSVAFKLWDFVVPRAGYVFENTLLGSSTYGRVNEGFGEVTLNWGKGISTNVHYAYRDQSYFDTPLFVTNSLRTGSRQVTGVRQDFAWKGVAFQFTGDGEFDRADAPWWSYDGFRFGLDAAFRVWVLNFGLGAAYDERHYKAVYPGTLKQRLDREQVYSAAVTYMITHWLSASLINTTVINDSNIPNLFEYTRNITGIFFAAGLP